MATFLKKEMTHQFISVSSFCMIKYFSYPIRGLTSRRGLNFRPRRPLLLLGRRHTSLSHQGASEAVNLRTVAIPDRAHR